MQTESAPKPSNATLRQVSDYLQVSERTVVNLQIRGVLKTVHLGRRRFFRWSDVEKLARTGVSNQELQEA